MLSQTFKTGFQVNVFKFESEGLFASITFLTDHLVNVRTLEHEKLLITVGERTQKNVLTEKSLLSFSLF